MADPSSQKIHPCGRNSCPVYFRFANNGLFYLSFALKATKQNHLLYLIVSLKELLCALLVSHRAAMKMANIDAAFDFMFTSPKNEHGVRKIQFLFVKLLFVVITLSPA